MASAFNDQEKRFLLAEMIRVSETDITSLVEFVKTKAVGWNFYSMIAPPGHTMEQCVQAAESLLDMRMPQASLERAAAPTTTSSPPKRPATTVPPSTSPPLVAEPGITMAPILPCPPGAAPPFSPVPTISRSSHVPIQPRPPPPNGPVSNTPPPHQVEGPPAKKRRGRPPRKPIDHSSLLIPPKIAPLVSHTHLPQPPHPPKGQGLPGQSPSMGTPPREVSNPGTPTSSYSATAAPSYVQQPPASGTPRGRKRGRLVPTDDNAEPRSVEDPLHKFHNTLAIARTEAPTTSPRWTMDSMGRPYPGEPMRGPTLPPLTQGEPSTQPISPMKKERPAPLTT